MGKKRSLKDDLDTLKKKVTESCAKSQKTDGDAGLRSLRKRLKRVQRKISSRAARIEQAAGKKKAKA